MNLTGRRGFLKQISLLGVASFLPASALVPFDNTPSPFKISLNPGAIGATYNAEELLAAAIKYRFDAITPLGDTLIRMGEKQAKSYYQKMQEAGISWDALALPVDFRGDIRTFRKDIEILKERGEFFQQLGITGCSTWIMPTHDRFTYRENFDLHVVRLQEVASVLDRYGMRLGLEYVGPLTLRNLKKFPFISTLKETKALIKATGQNNIGVQLDSFHWYCAGEGRDDLLTLSPDEIITCDLNDAVAGRNRSEQLDHERELPGKSGVIDLKVFLKTLQEIGYHGPVRAEPFNSLLNDLNNEEAVAKTARSLKLILKLTN